MNLAIYAQAPALDHQKSTVVHGHQGVVPGAFVQREALLARDFKAHQRAQVGLVLAQGHQQTTARPGQGHKGLTAVLVALQHVARTLGVLCQRMKHRQHRLALVVRQVQARWQIQPSAGALVDGLVGWCKQIQHLAIGRKSVCGQGLASQGAQRVFSAHGMTWVNGVHHDR